MVKVDYHGIADGSTLSYLVKADELPIAIFIGSKKGKYKRYFNLKGIGVFRLNGGEAIEYSYLVESKSKKKEKQVGTPLFGDLPDVRKEHVPISKGFSSTGKVQGSPRFNGDDYKPERDDERLTGQIERVFNAIKDGRWLTLDDIASLTGDPQASISAQLRHLRKERFGSHDVRKRHVDNGLYEYRMFASCDS